MTREFFISRERSRGASIVARVGGLADTVIDANDAALQADVATGFQFSPVDQATLEHALDRAALCYADKTLWQGSLTSSSFYYTESGVDGTPYGPGEPPANGSPFARMWTELRAQLDGRHLKGGRWDARIDARVRSLFARAPRVQRALRRGVFFGGDAAFGPKNTSPVPPSLMAIMLLRAARRAR